MPPPGRRIAPRASKVTVLFAPDKVLGAVPPRAAVMAVGGGTGAPAGNKVANPAINCCLSRGSIGPPFPAPKESVQTIQLIPLWETWRLICVLRRTASKRV